MSKKPNIIVITTHDTGRRLGCYGASTTSTPNLDRFAETGVRFTSYFTCATFCSPSRGVQMTGRYPQTNGMMNLCHPPWNWKLNDGEKHLSHLLHDAGYYTILLGHQHETTDIDGQLCFDKHGLHKVPGTWSHLPCDEVADGVCEFLEDEAAAKAPFFLQLGFFETHEPYDFGGAEADDSLGVAIPPYLADTPVAREKLAALQGNTKKMDRAVGRVLESLDKNGLADDTLVIFTVDHGIAFPRAKATLYDPGMEIALIMRWPGGGVCGGAIREQLLSNVDFTPTVLDLAGVPISDSIEGESFSNVIRDDSQPGRDAIFGLLEGHGIAAQGLTYRCIRTDRYKLIRNFEAAKHLAVPVDLEKQTRAANRPLLELYDLERDPNEFNDLSESAEHAAIVKELDAQLWSWMESCNDPILKGPVPSPTYNAAMQGYEEFCRERQS